MRIVERFVRKADAMWKRKVSFLCKLLCVCACLVLIMIGLRSYFQPQEEEMGEDLLPLMVMIDGRLYEFSDETAESPSGKADGTIKEILAGENTAPYKNEQANFGIQGMEYWVIDDEILVQWNDSYLLFQAVG